MVPASRGIALAYLAWLHIKNIAEIWNVIDTCPCLGNKRVNFLLDVDGKPKIGVIEEKSRESVTEHATTADDHSANNTNRLTSHLILPDI